MSAPETPGPWSLKDFPAIIKVVRTLLSFFTLVLLLVGGVFGFLASIDKDLRAFLVVAIALMVILLVGIVAYLAVKYPWVFLLDTKVPETGTRQQVRDGRQQDLGNFPAFLPAIIEAIGNARIGSEIQIACDYVGYGMFNAGEMSDRYRDALIAASKRGCTVQIVELGSKPWRQLSTLVPPEYEKIFEMLKGKEEFRKNLNGLTERLKELELFDVIPATWTRATQLMALVRIEERYHEILAGKGIKIKVVPGPLPLYLWITETSAIWAPCPLEPRMRFPLIWYDVLAEGRINPANPLDEHGFLSSDPGFIERFRQVWRQYNEDQPHVESVSAGAG